MTISVCYMGSAVSETHPEDIECYPKRLQEEVLAFYAVSFLHISNSQKAERSLDMERVMTRFNCPVHSTHFFSHNFSP